MPRELLSPEAARLEAGRATVRERLRWLAPNARRAKELMAEQRRLTIAALKAEVAGARSETDPSSAVRAPSPTRGEGVQPQLPLGDQNEERRPRFWWVEADL